jgi:hypothetical protein
MKTNKLFKNIVWGMTLCGALCTTSCTSFDELNTDPTRMDEVNPGTLLDPILYDMGTYNWNRKALSITDRCPKRTEYRKIQQRT